LASHLPGGDVEAVPDVDAGDGEDQGRQCLLVVVPGGFVPDLIGYRSALSLMRVTASVQRQRRTLGIGEVGRIPPGRHCEEPLVCFAEFPRNAKVLDGTDAAPIDLACAQIDQFERLRRQAGLVKGLP